jgi:membrane protease YdiL (CAAX protease family)
MKRNKLSLWLKTRIEMIALFVFVVAIGTGTTSAFLYTYNLNSMHDVVVAFGDDGHVLLALLIANLLPELGLLFVGVGIMAIARASWHIPLSDIGMTKPHISPVGLIVLLLSPFAVLLMSWGARSIAPWWQGIVHVAPLDRTTVLTAFHGLPLSTALMVVHIVIVAPVCEEVLFRGVLQFQLARWLPAWAVVLIIPLVSILFAVGHEDLGALLSYVGAGLVFGLVAQMTRSIWPAIIVHALVNGLFVLMVLTR